MIKPAHIAGLLIWSFLLQCAGLAICDAATAGTNDPPPVAMRPAGRVYLFRGVAGLLFSRGMDQLSAQINRVGVPASVHDFMMCRAVGNEAIDDYRRDPEPITVIGHSAGGICGLAFSEMLEEKNIPVKLLVTIDPTRFDPIQIAHNVPHNIERFINIYQSNSFFGGGDVLEGQGFQGHYASFDLSRHDEITHINIDKIETVHDQLVGKILQLPDTPVNTQGPPVPIRYTVPAHAPIELWDSGMAVFARAGDTLATLAVKYRLPLWSLTQINPLPTGDPLPAGQRVIIPRHLLPSASSVSGAISKLAPAAR